MGAGAPSVPKSAFLFSDRIIRSSAQLFDCSSERTRISTLWLIFLRVNKNINELKPANININRKRSGNEILTYLKVRYR